MAKLIAGKERIIRAYRQKSRPWVGTEIARELGISRQRVHEALKSEGISTWSEGVYCRSCGKRLKRRYKYQLCFGCYWRMKREAKRREVK